MSEPNHSTGAGADADFPQSRIVDALPPKAMKVAAERRALLVGALPLFVEGLTQTDVCRALGCSAASLSRTLALAGAGTPLERCERLLARPLEELVEAPRRSGGRSDFEVLLESAELQQEVRELYLATLRASSEPMTHRRHTGSMALALKRLADHPACPDWAREKLRRGAQPAPLLRFLRHITPELEQLVRGERKFRLHGPSAQKDNTLRLPDGRRARMLAGFRVVMDDMSTNQPFYCDIVERGVVTQTILSRQGLYAMDEATWRWLGVELVARPREAYRAEDILRFVHRLMALHGKFDVLVLEQGIWAARSIAGYKVVEGGVEYEAAERPEMAAEERANLAAGLRGIGVQIDYVTSARGKTIEGAFGHLQPVLATFTRDFQNIGAHAGEFERAAKMLRRVRAGSHHPETLCFAPMDILRDRIVDAMQWINARKRDCVGGSSSDEAWMRDMGLRELPPLADYERAVFLTGIRERELRGGAIHFSASLTGYPFSFRAGEVFAELGDGYHVIVKFDEGNPAVGAAILNNEPPDNPRNARRLRPGQFLCWAEFELCAPRAEVTDLPAGHVAVEDYYGLGNPLAYDHGDAELRKQKRWLRSAAAVLPRPGQPAIKSSTLRDGRGNSLDVNGDQPRPRSAALPDAAARARSRAESPAHYQPKARTVGEDEELKQLLAEAQ